MKTLFLLRHAKSSWDDPNLPDFERPLNKRGLEAAPFMGKLMKERKIQPDIILSSPAKRAAQTAELIKESAQLKANIVFDKEIYEASSLKLLFILSNIEDKYSSVLLVGHNPGMEELLRILTGQNESMPTAALAKVELEISAWKDISENSGKLVFLIKPKEEMKS
ncbi:MAG: histidine phosphatase family protein [Acidobacteria bacterium]|jgi:phosphohistidine phosphatase|nr:MAG: histidine phosphatase family protein [Acidobacteriota bacterium]GIU82396.1 MAG: phosphoglycerate mutase [Pyrinomonadaceae bacterium]